MSALTWGEHDGVTVLVHDGVTVAAMATGDGIAPLDTPKPHLHPLRTLSGVTVTGFAPDDHPWHHGLMFAFPRVDDHNLWGGGTYLDPERGYVVIPNQGAIRIVEQTAASDETSATLAQLLSWRGQHDEPLLLEDRTWTFTTAGDPAALVIDLDTTLRSATGHDVALETPAQNGRPDGGYGGLFLRLEDGFTAREMAGDDGTDAREPGVTSSTYVVQGDMPGGEPVTIGMAFADDGTPGARRFLHRFEPFAALNPAVAYDDALTVEQTQPLRFRHRVAVLDGDAEPAVVRDLLRRQPSTAAR